MAAQSAMALVRVAGMPCSAWTAAGSPELFRRVADHALAGERHAARARRLAGRLGAEVVPRPGLAPADRRAVLAWRRRLHAGAAPGPEDLRLLRRLPGVPPELAAAADELHAAGTLAAAERDALECDLAAERERTGQLGWALAGISPVLADFVEAAAPGMAADVARRLAGGESWDGRGLRKRAAFIWRAVGRAAAKTTPRGWAGQVAALPVASAPGPGAAGGVGGAGHAGRSAGAVNAAGPSDPGVAAGALLLPPGAELGELAACAVENVHVLRTRLSDPEPRSADPGTLLALTPLHLSHGTGDAATLTCHVIDPNKPGRLRQITLRRTRPLGAVCAALDAGPRTLAELRAALPELAPELLDGFLGHLLTRGVLQRCAVPRRVVTGWTAPQAVTGRDALPRPAPARGAWFTDSYRRLAATVPAEAAARVQRGLDVAARLARLRDAHHRPAVPGPPGPAELAELGERPRTVSEILARCLAPGGPPLGPLARQPLYAGWHPAGPDEISGPAASGYAGLLAWLAARAGDAEVDVDHALLDAFGAPPAAACLPPWPLDCLLRPLPGPGPVAVLETASAAGRLDARFADALQALHGGYRGVAAHRAFLAGVERRAGVRFVELLLPPLAERAANAVRRPVYTRWWTGDPDWTAYHASREGGGGPARFLPLDRITLRRDAGGRVIAEADGVRVLPIHHATRGPLPPYDLLMRLLLSAGHPAAARLIRLDGLGGAFPDSCRVPRLTAGGELVVSPAAWRVPRARLWRASDPELAKVRALALLRRATGLPRHAFVRPAASAKPVPVDLEALPALHVIERLCAQTPGPDLVIEEMLPGPDGLPLRDPLHGGAAVAAQLLLRLPSDRAADELAALAASALHDAAGPTTPGVHGGRSAGAVTPQ